MQYIAGSSPTDAKMRRKTTSKVNLRPHQTLPKEVFPDVVSAEFTPGDEEEAKARV
jgi:hypothetical protein